MNRECRIWAIYGNREYGILVDRNRENWILAVYMTLVCGNRECRFRFMGIGSVGSVLWESGVRIRVYGNRVDGILLYGTLRISFLISNVGFTVVVPTCHMVHDIMMNECRRQENTA